MIEELPQQRPTSLVAPAFSALQHVDVVANRRELRGGRRSLTPAEEASGPRAARRPDRTNLDRLVWRSRDSSFAMAKRKSSQPMLTRLRLVQRGDAGSDLPHALLARDCGSASPQPTLAHRTAVIAHRPFSRVICAASVSILVASGWGTCKSAAQGAPPRAATAGHMACWPASQGLWAALDVAVRLWQAHPRAVGCVQCGVPTTAGLALDAKRLDMGARTPLTNARGKEQ